MQIESKELDNGVTHVALSGRLDIAGAGAADMKLSVISGSRRKVIVDLSGVTFIGSMGLRVLITAARTIAGKGGKLALLGAQAEVDRALRVSAIDSIIPMLQDMPEALATVGA